MRGGEVDPIPLAELTVTYSLPIPVQSPLPRLLPSEVVPFNLTTSSTTILVARVCENSVLSSGL